MEDHRPRGHQAFFERLPFTYAMCHTKVKAGTFNGVTAGRICLTSVFMRPHGDCNPCAYRFSKFLTGDPLEFL